MKQRKFFSKERSWVLFFLLFALIFVRFCYYGLQYFPQLDDYIQMHNQAAYYTFSQVVLDMGLLSSRPLASTLDVTLWSAFWPCMILAVALLSALYAGSAVLFRRVWGAYFGTGYVFLVLYALLPLGMEGTYWVSASTRILPALFFISLAMWLFQRWCREGKRAMLGLYFVTQLVSFCFYEQGLVLSVTGVLLVGILEFKTQRRRSLFALLTFVNAAIYFVFTGFFSTSSGQLGSRLKLSLPWQAGWDGVLKSAGAQTGSAFLLGGWKTLTRGFRRGLECMLADFNWLWVLLVLGLCVLLFCFARRFTGEGSRAGTALAVGFLMALAPITLFFVLENPAIALRNTVFSFCGLALMADALYHLLFSKAAWKAALTGALCAGLALIFCVCSVSELHDYRDTYENDQRAGRAVIAALDGGRSVPLGTRVGVLNLMPDYLPEQNFKYHQHIHGATESVWAFTGLLSCESGNRDFPYCTPLPGDVPEGADFDLLLWYNPETGTATEYTGE